MLYPATDIVKAGDSRTLFTDSSEQTEAISLNLFWEGREGQGIKFSQWRKMKPLSILHISFDPFSLLSLFPQFLKIMVLRPYQSGAKPRRP